MMIEVFRQSAIKLKGEKVIYFDPFKIKPNEVEKADMIFITHDHYDHYDLESIEKLKKEETVLIVPTCLEERAKQITSNVKVVKPNIKFQLDGITIQTIPAYNLTKSFHPKEKEYVGYLITIEKQTYYIMGDTDVTPEAMNVRCDYLFIPIGGLYTMNLEEAVYYVHEVKPKKVIPIHYGSIIGEISLGEKFRELINKDIEVELYIKEE